MKAWGPVFAALTLMVTACGGSIPFAPEAQAEPDVVAAEEPVVTAATTTTTSVDSVPAVFDPATIEQSVVQIQAVGTFEFLDGTAKNSPSTGSGFVVSEHGLVVTNNHVVQGAGHLQVTFSDSVNPLNARIVGVNECSDLAVLQLEGSGYAPLELGTGPVSAGTSVYSAGYPARFETDFDHIGYTLTQGIVNSNEANGQSAWASVDSVIQHDARIMGGNSGGPLVSSEDGTVVGINYAANDALDESYAIGVDELNTVIDQLSQEINVDSIGINGEALYPGDPIYTGIFVSSVQTGSIADKAGIIPGDVLVSLEHLDIGLDGTFSDYCNVLRTQGTDSVMSLKVYRPSLGVYLSGQLNGVAIDPTSGVAPEGGADGYEPPEYINYVTVSDDSGLISVEIPAEWAQIDPVLNPDFGPSLWASTNLQRFWSSWTVPGVVVEKSDTLTSADIDLQLAKNDMSEWCAEESTDPYDDGVYAGVIKIWVDCAQTETSLVVVVGSPVAPDQDYLVWVMVQIVNGRDFTAADKVLSSFLAL